VSARNIALDLRRMAISIQTGILGTRCVVTRCRTIQKAWRHLPVAAKRWRTESSPMLSRQGRPYCKLDREQHQLEPRQTSEPHLTLTGFSSPALVWPVHWSQAAQRW